MELQLMLRTAIVLLAATAAGGLLMAGLRLSGRPHPPPLVTMLHGVLAASGLTLLLYACFTSTLPAGAWAGLALLLAAALGGLVLNLGYHWKNLALPIWLMLVHGGIAVAGFLVLTLAVWNLKAG
jgi:hypothetical protein